MAIRAFPKMVQINPNIIPNPQILRREQWFSPYKFQVKHLKGKKSCQTSYEDQKNSLKNSRQERKRRKWHLPSIFSEHLPNTASTGGWRKDTRARHQHHQAPHEKMTSYDTCKKVPLTTTSMELITCQGLPWNLLRRLHLQAAYPAAW